MVSWVFDSGDASAELAARLAIELGAKSIRNGALSNWNKVSDTWRCPCCARAKPSIARLDKNGGLFGPIVEHHDHLSDEVAQFQRPSVPWSSNQPEWVDYNTRTREWYARVAGLIRFPRSWICGDCNNADTAAKAIVRAPRYFSFSPFEIRLFVRPNDHAPHDIKDWLVHGIYEPALVQVETLRERRFEIANALAAMDLSKTKLVSEPTEHIGDVAKSVIAQIDNARRAGGTS